MPRQRMTYLIGPALHHQAECQLTNCLYRDGRSAKGLFVAWPSRCCGALRGNVALVGLDCLEIPVAIAPDVDRSWKSGVALHQAIDPHIGPAAVSDAQLSRGQELLVWVWLARHVFASFALLSQAT